MARTRQPEEQNAAKSGARKETLTTATAPRPQTPAKTGRNAPRGPRGPHHTWTDQEREHIRANYEGTHDSRDQIARTLNVSPFAVAG